jgi:hypothetical protein
MGKITGVKALQQNMGRIFKDINEKKAPQFVNAALSVGEIHSKELAPVAYSFLVNNIIRNVDVVAGKVTGSIIYAQGYAAALEFGENWKPRPPPKYGNKKKGEPPAPAWNPQAVPHYLRKGFEDATSRAAIKKAEDIFKI